MSGNGHKSETPDVSHIRNVEVTHETSDINVRGVLVFVLVLTVATIAISAGMWLLFKFFNQQEARQEPKRGRMAVTKKEERLPPKPRLQAAPGFEVEIPDGRSEGLELQAPQAEYRVLKDYWDQALNGQLQDQSGNPMGVPINQAMEQVVSGQGLPARANTTANKLEDYAITMPTAASSGRQTEKRLQ
ncbi:MAG TPA: hypothetical protein VK893_00590 [Pyrinomonadaceae bacterium]|nr:hypothetical protein [Pyrinomonadaceae bacterium]